MKLLTPTTASFQTSTLERKELSTHFWILYIRLQEVTSDQRRENRYPFHPQTTANVVLWDSPAKEVCGITRIQTKDIQIIRRSLFSCTTREPDIVALKSDSVVWTAWGSSWHQQGAGQRKVLIHARGLREHGAERHPLEFAGSSWTAEKSQFVLKRSLSGGDESPVRSVASWQLTSWTKLVFFLVWKMCQL